MTELRFVSPGLRRLDEVDAEVLLCGMLADERPMRGLAGLVDWRLAGTLSRLAREAFVAGDVGETLLVPVRPRLPFDKLLVMGLGARARFDDDTFRVVLARAFDTMRGLSVKKAIVELPGRGARLVDAARAASLLFESTDDAQRDMLTLVESAEDAAAFEREATAARRASGKYA